MKRIIALFMLMLIGLGMFAITAEMPIFGEAESPVHNEVAERYLTKATDETGSINVVSAIITDYRAFDTLGEAAVLFAAIAAVYASLLAGSKSD